MEIIIKVDGMACGHCEASVKEALLDLEGIDSVDVNLDTKEVEIKGSKIEEDIINKTITDIGFEVI